MKNPRVLLPLLSIFLAGAVSAASNPADSVRDLMSGDLAAFGVSPDQAGAVWNSPPAVPPSASADSFKTGDLTTSCRTVAARRPWKYCVTTTAGSANKTILYFLHGLGHDERNWAESHDYKKAIRSEWKAAGVQAPIVVTVSFGGFWLLVDKNQSELSGLLDYFKTDVMPVVERDLGVDGTPRRLLMGESMGGFNTAQVVMKYPGDFARAALACPAVADLSPYSSKEEMKAYKAAPGVNRLKVAIMLHVGKKVFKSEEDYRRSDPFTIGKTLLGPATPPLLISSGDRDQYGLYKSDEEFAAMASAQGVDVTYTPLHGGHCSADPAAIARFLAAD